jgi:hypothetical protein
MPGDGPLGPSRREKTKILGTWCIGCAARMRLRSRKLKDVPPTPTAASARPSNRTAQRSVDPARSAPETSNLWHPLFDRSMTRRRRRSGWAAPAALLGLRKNPEDFWGNAPLARQLIGRGRVEERHPCVTAGSRADEAATGTRPGTATSPADRAAPTGPTAGRGPGAARARAGGHLCGRGGTGRRRARRAAGGQVGGPWDRRLVGGSRGRRPRPVAQGIVAGTTGRVERREDPACE